MNGCEVERHERAHGAVIEASGNSQAIIYYGIEWVVRGETVDVQPCNKVSGPVRKVHLAYSSMAPDDDLISPADIRIATELGYDITDIAGLRQRSEAVLPIPEDYDPNKGIADFLTRVMWVALHNQ